MNYINHITLSTGHCRRSPRAEVDDATLAILVPWLNTARQSGNIEPLPVAPLSHYGARVIKDVGLVVTIYGPRGPHTPGHPHTGEWLPLVTLGIAQRSREAGDLWASLMAHLGGKPGIKAPATPWVAVSIHDTITAYPESLQWIGDLERCIAWAWVTRNPAIKPAGVYCQRCGYPPGDDWLDDGETCPNCKLVQ